METDTIKNILYSIVAFVGIMFASFLIGYGCGQNQPTINDVEKVDTLFVYDTITQYKPILEERVILEKVPYPVTDTLWMRDTLFVYLEREQLIWEDSLSKIYASGIMPQIDSVQHYVKERIVTRELTKVVKNPCKWSIGINVGYGVQIGDQLHISPYIGVGISYNLLSW